MPDETTALVPSEAMPAKDLNRSDLLDLSDEELIRIMADQHNAGKQLLFDGFRRGLPHFRNAGVVLLIFRERFKGKYWTQWARENVPFSQRTTNAYMQLARDWEKLVGEVGVDGIEELTINDALRKIVNPDRPSRKRVERVNEPEPDLLVENDIKIKSNIPQKTGKISEAIGINRDEINRQLDEKD